MESVASNVDAAQTIALCAQHQTRIIDDILTLSKLDSSLLHITPVEVQPSVVVEKSLRIFDGELRKNGVNFKYIIEPSYSDLAIDWVMLDPSRVLRILINLLSNAIKFTSTQQRREIILSIGASKERPRSAYGVKYLPRRLNCQEAIEISDWGDGELLYLQFRVKAKACTSTSVVSSFSVSRKHHPARMCNMAVSSVVEPCLLSSRGRASIMRCICQ